MLFNSYVFVLLFFPITLLGWFGLNHFERYRAGNIFLICMSLFFYGYYNPKYLFVICISVVVNFLLSKGMERYPKQSKKLMILGIVGNVSAIFYFKYFNFFIDNINILFKTNIEIEKILLPLGISFFTFQQISYMVDSYRGETKNYSFLDYALFVVFFPQLIAGPIVMHKEIIPQFMDRTRRKLNPDSFGKGLYVFSMGLFKKVLIADSLSAAVSFGFSDISAMSGLEAFLVSLAYTFQLYFDFSGYCDMALGIGQMLNIDLPQNFNSPYKAVSIVDFWSRWHMTLTRFLREYIYFPLGGSRRGTAMTYRNIMIIFLVSGIWHGANWTFIVWGVLHGVVNCLTRAGKKQWDAMPRVLQWCLTFLMVDLLWVIFRADSMADAGLFFQRLFTGGFAIRTEFFQLLPLYGRFGVPGALVTLTLLIVALFYVVLRQKNSFEITFTPTRRMAILTAFFLVVSIVHFAGVSEFLYFAF